MSRSDHGSGDDEDFTTRPRMSAESAIQDHETLDDDQEQHSLLTGQRTQRKPNDDRQRNAIARLSRAAGHHKNGKHARKEVMHEMEEGGPISRSSSSDSSSEFDREKMGSVLAKEKSYRKRRCFGFTLIHAFILGLFVAIAYGAYRASKTTKHSHHQDAFLSNGTSLFAPTTILISLDGFRADFLERGLTPTLEALVQHGVSPEYMTPSFPSLTFPNHYTLVTGLLPESHGIVANTFWDVHFQEDFSYTHREHSMQAKWWYPHPLWETAELQDVPTAIHMWPGSEAHIGDAEPLHMDKYNGEELLHRKVDRILEWLDKPGPKDEGWSAGDARPQLIAAYVPNVDADGHKYGPNSTEIRQTIQDVDVMLQDMFLRLGSRNLTDIVNVVVVSDHGMATTSNERLVQLEDIVDTSLIEHTDGWPHYGLRPKNVDDIPKIHDRLVQEASKREGFEVYLRDEDMPERYHFVKNDRIAPLWIMAKPGWAIVKRDEYDVAKGVGSGDVYHPRGIHGYDNEHPLMRAIFIARGPAFPHEPGSKVEPFQNTNVYNIICDSLGIEPLPNNGTMRLPLKTIGLHAGETNEADASTTALSPPAATSEGSGGDVQDTRPVVNKPEDETADESADEKLMNLNAYLQWLKNKWAMLVDWAKHKGGNS